MKPQITLGPLLFHWDEQRRKDFYARIADEAPIDTVYLGEVVCSKRAPFSERDLPEVIERLERGGKTVVLSTLAEVVLKRERAATADLCGQASYPVEVNNTAGLMAVRGRAHRIGPLMNVYNEHTMAHLAGLGADHFTLPVEVPRAVVAGLAAAAVPEQIGIEVQVFGRASLALSSRCFHARAHGRSKDECQFVCGEDLDGMTLTTMGGEPMMAINGIQTLSHGMLNLAAEIGDMLSLGVRHFRLSPHSCDMVAVAEVFADRIAGKIPAAEAAERLRQPEMPAFVNGFWHGKAGHLYDLPDIAQTA